MICFLDPSKLEKWLEEVAHELKSDGDHNELKYLIKYGFN